MTRNWHGWRDERAAQLVEFAVALPLLMVFVVGIFDFSGAFTLKQKLTNISRDAARAAAADPATDLCQTCTAGLPASVNDALQLVQGYLVANNINGCGISPSLYVNGPGPIWTFSVTPTSSSPCGITLIINRGYYFPAGAPPQPAPVNCRPGTPTGTQVVATCVSIQYAYQWRFGKVVSLLGSTATLPTNITAVAVAMNEN
jgi:hypothetical protein